MLIKNEFIYCFSILQNKNVFYQVEFLVTGCVLSRRMWPCCKFSCSSCTPLDIFRFSFIKKGNVSLELHPSFKEY